MATVAKKMVWDVEPMVSAGPLLAGVTIGEAIAELRELGGEPRILQPPYDVKAAFRELGVTLHYHDDLVH